MLLAQSELQNPTLDLFSRKAVFRTLDHEAPELPEVVPEAPRLGGELRIGQKVEKNRAASQKTDPKNGSNFCWIFILFLQYGLPLSRTGCVQSTIKL